MALLPCSFIIMLLNYLTLLELSQERIRRAMQMRESRKEAVSRHKRELILGAARSVFAEEGLEGASLRAIATRAGYTAAALYFHFDSKEAIYAEVLRQSLASLGEAVSAAVATTRG